MKIITIGDLHGLDTWKQVNFNEFDLSVFLGDYTDSFTISDEDIYDNLKSLIELKKELKDKMVLLIGNHDMHYISGHISHRCSGFRHTMFAGLFALLNDNLDLFQLAYQHENYLWSHAGVHKGWYKNKYTQNDDNLAVSLNNSFKNREECLFDVGVRRGGSDNVGGPLWLDATMLYKKPLPDYHQIVGHTRMKKINTITKSETTSVTFCDVMEDNPDFYTLEL